ncbi:hypothetical protein DPMN_045244 [Dreissena polymorpha]|uniref:Uncharacterized protein n=1 Tax=Dreissena polymorpha TaxID=45954 RepID=A0A9D4D656_DREPO|nr:hypothetical protein DPMN_045244 [Dreissena polymorpha]
MNEQDGLSQRRPTRKLFWYSNTRIKEVKSPRPMQVRVLDKFMLYYICRSAQDERGRRNRDRWRLRGCVLVPSMTLR